MNESCVFPTKGRNECITSITLTSEYRFSDGFIALSARKIIIHSIIKNRGYTLGRERKDS